MTQPIGDYGPLGDYNLDPPDTSAQDHAAEAAQETCEQEMKELRAYLRKRLAVFSPTDATNAIQEARDNIANACSRAIGEGAVFGEKLEPLLEDLGELNAYDEAVEFLADTIAKGDKR